MDTPMATLSQQVEFLERANDALHETIPRLMQQQDLNSLCREIFRVLGSVLSFDAGYIEDFDAVNDSMETICMIDEGIEVLERKPWNYQKSVITRWIVENKQTVRFDDLHRDATARFPQHRISAFGNTEKRSRAWMGIPLLVSDTLVGIINIQSYQEGIYGDKEQQFLEVLANVIAIALGNIGMISRLETRINELFVPYITFDDNTAIVPLVDGLSADRLNNVVERVLEFVVQFGHEHVLFDLSAIHSYDEYLIQSLSMLIKALELSGTHPILIGMHPVLIEGLVHMEATFEGIGIARDLTSALKMR